MGQPAENIVAIRANQFEHKPEVGFITGKGALPPVPVFPLATLGKFWGDFICDHAGKSLPRDFFAMSLIGTVAGLIGNSREAALPAPSSHKEAATLWCINVGLPSTGKTPAIQPFVDIVTGIEADHDTTIKVEDATIAGTIDSVVDNPDGIMVMNDELSGWWSTFQQDRQGETFWLKAWVGRNSYSHARKRSRFVIPRLNIGVVGGTQPATLGSMIDATGKVEKGFVSRCMFSYPDFPVSNEPTGNAPDNDGADRILRSIHGLGGGGFTTTLPVADDAAAYHEEWWNNLQSDLWVDPCTPEGQWLAKQRGTSLRLALVLEVLWAASGTTPDAKTAKRIRDLQAMADPASNGNEHQRRIAQQKLDSLLEGTDIYAGRRHPAGGPAEITLRAMKAATDLVLSYFYPHFMRCEGFAYQPVNEAAAIALCRVLVNKEVETFNARAMRKWEWPHGKVHSALHGNGKGVVDTVNEVLDLLVEKHIIRLAPSTNKTGRPSSDYEVNPLLATLAKRALNRR